VKKVDHVANDEIILPSNGFLLGANGTSSAVNDHVDEAGGAVADL
jgi:hypothetical protein